MTEKIRIAIWDSSPEARQMLAESISRHLGIPCTVEIISSDMNENGGTAEISIGYELQDARTGSYEELEAAIKKAHEKLVIPRKPRVTLVDPWRQKRRTPWRKRR